MSNLRYSHMLTIAAVVGLALNLRPALAAVGPLLDMIEAVTELTHTQSGLLTALPVFVMGLFALSGRYIAARLSEQTGIGLGIALVCAACLARYGTSGSIGLLCTAVLAGIGIALVQTLLPGFIKRIFTTDSGRIFALYTTGIMGGAAIAAASAATIATHWGWQMALAVWALPALLAFYLWRRCITAPGMLASGITGANARPARRSFWRNWRAWELMVFFGIGTGAYTLVLAWLPPFYTSLGWQPSAAGLLLGEVTLAEVASGLAVSAWIGRFPDRRQPLIAVLISLMAGLACLIIAPQALAYGACLLLGIGIGALFPMSLILTLDHIEDPAEAGMLAAFVQGGGYIIAAFMPLFAGILRDQFSKLIYAWMLMLVGTAVMVLMCSRFSPESYRRINVERNA